MAMTVPLAGILGLALGPVRCAYLHGVESSNVYASESRSGRDGLGARNWAAQRVVTRRQGGTRSLGVPSNVP